MIRACSLLFLAATIPSVVHGFSFGESECSAHADCGSEAYCYDAGYFTTGDWNGVGYCSSYPPHCCGGSDGDPIDGDVGNCPAASQCESTTATASNCEDVCEGHGHYEKLCLAVSDSCEWTNGACSSSVNAGNCSYYPSQMTIPVSCTAHADCSWNEYCFDSGKYLTGVWSGEGYCSENPENCCGNAYGDPIDQNVANCPAASQCESTTARATNCEDVCEGYGYDAAQCAAVSASCEWHDGACWSGVGDDECSYYPSQTSPLGTCSAHADCGSDAYCYDSGYFTTGDWNGVGYCSSYPPHCCGGSDGDPIDGDVGNCPAASQCESTTATASNCEDVCEGHGYNAAQCVAVSNSCEWTNGACSSRVDDNSCSYYPSQTSSLGTCSAHADCGSEAYCYDSGFFLNGAWNGVGYCSPYPSHCCGDADGDPIDQDVSSCPAASRCGITTATASNCEDVCEGHGYDQEQCAAASVFCEWDIGACWSGVGPISCSYYTDLTGTAVECDAHADCGSDAYCYDSGYFMTGDWNGVGYCDPYPSNCCGYADGDPIDGDVGNCPAASQCINPERASNCEDVCEGHGYDQEQCAAVSASCHWDDGACWSGVGSNACIHYPPQTTDLESTTTTATATNCERVCEGHDYDASQCAAVSDACEWDNGACWSGVGPNACEYYSSASPSSDSEAGAGNPPQTTDLESTTTTATATNCERVCEGHDYDASQCAAVSASCHWDDGACWSGVGPNACEYYSSASPSSDSEAGAGNQTESDTLRSFLDSESATPKVFDAFFAIVTLCALALNSR